jgi:hypothetical protein
MESASNVKGMQQEQSVLPNGLHGILTRTEATRPNVAMEASGQDTVPYDVNDTFLQS